MHNNVRARIARSQQNQKRNKSNGLHARKSNATEPHLRHHI
jgi:hypothetical protein